MTISQYGVVSATLPGQTTPAHAGDDSAGELRQSGRAELRWAGACLRLTPASGNAVTDAPGGNSGAGTLQQGYLENSNVDVVTEFVQMILAQRAYESNSKVVHVADDMYRQINGLVR